jgi:DSF synthase
MNAVIPFYRQNSQIVDAESHQYLSNYLNPSCGGVQWSILHATAPKRFTSGLLTELLRLQKNISTHYLEHQDVNFHVFSSDIPGVFSLGGDLEFFCECARNGDKDSLRKYGRDAVSTVFNTAVNFNLPITTINIVKGAALGGGFEAALASNHLIAEEQSTFAFPETRFGLFPGMGAYTLLRKRVTEHQAEEIIYSSKAYTAKELYDLGIVDQICEQGQGYKTAMQHIQERYPRHQGIQSMRKMAQKFSPLDKQEMLSIVDYWVESVMNLNTKQLRMIEILSKTDIKHQI